MNVNSVQNSSSTDLARKIMTYQADSNVQFNSSLFEFIGQNRSQSRAGKETFPSNPDQNESRLDSKKTLDSKTTGKVRTGSQPKEGYKRSVNGDGSHGRVTNETSSKIDSVSIQRTGTSSDVSVTELRSRSLQGNVPDLSNDTMKGQADRNGIADKAIDAYAKATRAGNVIVSTNNNVPLFKEVNRLDHESIASRQGSKTVQQNGGKPQHNFTGGKGLPATPNAQTSGTIGVANATNQNPASGKTGFFSKIAQRATSLVNGGTPQQGISAVNSTAGTLGGVESATAVQQSAQSNISERINQIQTLLSKTGGSIMKLVKGGGGKMSLRLDPPSLGKLQVEVEISRNICNARIVTEDPMVKTALMLNLAQLRESLESQGLKLDGFSIESQSDLDAQSKSGSRQPWDGFSDRERLGLNASEGLTNIDQNKQSDTMKVNTRPILGGVDLHI